MIRCRTPDGTHPLRGPAAAATKIDIGTETESEGEGLDIVVHPRSLLAVNMKGEGGDTDRRLAMHDLGATTIALQTAGRTTDTTGTVTVDRTAAGTGSTGRRATSTPATPRQATTTDADEIGTTRTPTGGKAAGVSTNEGGVEPGPIAHPPR